MSRAPTQTAPAQPVRDFLTGAFLASAAVGTLWLYGHIALWLVQAL